MTALVKIVIEQGSAFLVGLLFVTIVRPETIGGVLLLLAIAVAVVNLLIKFVKWRRAQTKRSAKPAELADPVKTAEAASAAVGALAASAPLARANAANAHTAAERIVLAKWAEQEEKGVELVKPTAAAISPRSDQQQAEAANRNIFISYRRQNDAALAGRISDLLAGEFDIFMDVDAIRLGTDFVEAINDEIAKCDVLIAVIGRDWLDARDETGNRRLDDPNDFVRIEIGAALQRQIPVVPILIDGTKMPKAAQLPANLQSLARRNALDLRNASFKPDIGRLVQQLQAEATRI
jgi:TIR domain